jgi:DNA-binding NarL/FixJ family response regulator
MNAIRVLLVDDHALVRAGLKLLLQGTRDFVVREAGDGGIAMQMLRQEQPELLITDVTMPNVGGLELAAHVRREYPGVKVIVLSVHADEEYVLRALQAGASGYLLKDSAPRELDLAVWSVLGGDVYLSPPISKHVVAGYVARTGAQSRDEVDLDLLTVRQKEVLQMIGAGQVTKQIARHLGVSIKTVEAHRSQIMHRLNVHGLPALVRFAIRTGLVSVDA